MSDHTANELRLLKSAIGHLAYIAPEIPADVKNLGLTGLAWRRLPGDEAAAIERACSFANGRCDHGWFSLCREPGCVALVEQTYRDWNADHEAARIEEVEMDR